MSNLHTPMPDSTDIRAGSMIEAAYGGNKLSREPQPLTCMSAVRNFGNGGALIHGLNPSGDGAVLKECNMLDDSLVPKHFYDRSSEYVKCDSVAWEDFVNVPGTNVASAESLPDGTLCLSTPGSCKFIKDEKEPAVIMDGVCPNFDAPSDALDTCCDANTKQQVGLVDGEPVVSFPRPGLDASPNFLIELNQADQLLAPSQARSESRCGFNGRAATNFDTNRQTTGQQLTMYKNEASRWQTPVAEPHFWCQTAGGAEDAFAHSGYDGIQSQPVAQRNPSPFSAFPR